MIARISLYVHGLTWCDFVNNRAAMETRSFKYFRKHRFNGVEHEVILITEIDLGKGHFGLSLLGSRSFATIVTTRSTNSFCTSDRYPTAR
jgi:hypothetical protein